MSSMWATYNYDNFPTVNVSISGIIENDDDFSQFIQEWLTLFRKGDDFNFYFDTLNCGLINLKYALWMAIWIKRFKWNRYKNLKFSKILVSHSSVLYLLRLIFYIERPIAPVEVIYKKNQEETISEIFNP